MDRVLPDNKVGHGLKKEVSQLRLSVLEAEKELNEIFRKHSEASCELCIFVIKSKRKGGWRQMQETMYDELVRGLLEIFSDQASQIVLYGSTARGTAAADSDMDMAVFLNKRPGARQEELLSDLVADLNFKYDKVFSVIDIDLDTYMKWCSVAPFCQNVDQEGIVLWKAA